MCVEVYLFGENGFQLVIYVCLYFRYYFLEM